MGTRRSMRWGVRVRERREKELWRSFSSVVNGKPLSQTVRTAGPKLPRSRASFHTGHRRQ